MIEINGTKYKLGLIDTCIFGRILKNENGERDQFFRIFFNDQITIAPCTSIWSILELRQKRELYDLFIEFFSVIPLCLLKTPLELLKEEIEIYPNYKSIDPILFTFSLVRDKSESISNLMDLVFNKPEVQESEKKWKIEWKNEVLQLLLSLKKNFNPQGRNFKETDAKEFLKQGISQYIITHYPNWFKANFKNIEELDINAFPSVKLSFYNVFYRLYLSQRAPESQDIFDIAINNCSPYTDFVLTEKYQADIFKKIKNNDGFIEHLEISTIKNLV